MAKSPVAPVPVNSQNVHPARLESFTLRGCYNVILAETGQGVTIMGIRITASKFGMAFGATMGGNVSASGARAQTPPPPSPPTFQCQEVPKKIDPDLPVLKP